jgi:hypothetical protein
MACRAGINSYPQFRDLNSGTHTPHHADSEVFWPFHPELVPYRFSMPEQLGIDKPVTTGIAGGRNDENIGKIGDIFCMVKVFNFSIATGTRTRNDRSHL